MRSFCTPFSQIEAACPSQVVTSLYRSVGHKPEGPIVSSNRPQDIHPCCVMQTQEAHLRLMARLRLVPSVVATTFCDNNHIKSLGDDEDSMFLMQFMTAWSVSVRLACISHYFSMAGVAAESVVRWFCVGSMRHFCIEAISSVLIWFRRISNMNESSNTCDTSVCSSAV